MHTFNFSTSIELEQKIGKTIFWILEKERNILLILPRSYLTALFAFQLLSVWFLEHFGVIWVKLICFRISKWYTRIYSDMHNVMWYNPWISFVLWEWDTCKCSLCGKILARSLQIFDYTVQTINSETFGKEKKNSPNKRITYRMSM